MFDKAIVAITGAAGTLGQAVAKAFSKRGANCLLIDRNADLLRTIYGEGQQDKIFALDLMNRDDLVAAVKKYETRFGPTDILCNLAGGFSMGSPVHATSPGELNDMFDVNTRSIFNTAHAIVPSMLARGGGRIVNVAATAGLRGGANMSAYAVSKSAVIRITESMSAELRERNINVNCVLPSIIDTPANRAAMPNEDPKRWVSPDALADVILFLSSPAARAIHGAAIPVVGMV